MRVSNRKIGIRTHDLRNATQPSEKVLRSHVKVISKEGIHIKVSLSNQLEPRSILVGMMFISQKKKLSWTYAGYQTLEYGLQFVELLVCAPYLKFFNQKN